MFFYSNDYKYSLQFRRLWETKKKKLLIAGPISRIFYLIGMAWRLGIGITWKKNNSNNNKVIWYATDIPQYHFRREEF